MKLLLLIALFTLTTQAQSYYYSHSIGTFSSPLAFHVNSAGAIYVTDDQTGNVFKYDTLGTLLRRNGGFGWDKGVFDKPIDIFSTPLNVLVTDYNNHRIQRFDKDLNFLSLITTRESSNFDFDARFGYPVSSALSPQGDLYILDSENKRVLKFDLFGNYIQHFGGYDFGTYSLSNPRKLAISQSNDIFVLDDHKIFIFNQFGTGTAIIDLPENIINMNIHYNHLTLNTAKQIFYIDLRSADLTITPLRFIDNEDQLDILSSMILNNKIYLLTRNTILVFNKE